MTSRAPALVELARLAHSVRFEELPPDVVAVAKALIVDTLGCACGGAHGTAFGATRAMAEHLGGAAQASVWCTELRTTMPLATLVNGTALRYLDSNDYVFARDPAHPSGNLAVALAVGEHRRINGRELIASLVAAYEIHLRFAEAAGAPALWKRGWHHGTNAQFSSAALASRLLQGDHSVTAHAMAISGSHHNTLAQLQSGEIAMIKASAEAWVAKGGVESALLAVNGMTGPLELLEGRHGWADTVAGEVDFEVLLGPIGRRYRLLDACIKPYPAVATAMAPIRAALDISGECINRLDSIERVEVRLPAYALGTPSAHPDRRYPQRRESADHSFYYCVAIALLDGACGEKQFEERNLTRPELQALLGRIELREEPAFNERWPAAAGGGVTVIFKDGRVLDRSFPFPPGHPRLPLSTTELATKFHEYADPLLSRDRALGVRALVDSLEFCDDVGELSRAMSRGTV